jgi:hypothetical protein
MNHKHLLSCSEALRLAYAMVMQNETVSRATAQGETALKEFLKHVAEVWNSFVLDLTDYQNKCHVIRGWDDLFNKVKEHINSLSAMKLSPYYKVLAT